MIWILITGLLGGLSFPTAMGSYHFPDLGFLAWGALIPLYLRLKKASIRDAFYSGLVFGAGLYGVSLYWIFIAMHHYGQVPIWGSLLGLFVMVFLLSLYLGATLSLAVFLAKKAVPLFVTLPLAWVTQDFLKNYFPFGGFPWSSLGYTQHYFLTLLQMLDVTGIYGITFLVILGNLFLAELYLWIRAQRAFPFKESICLAIILSLVLFYGKTKLSVVNRLITEQPKLRVSLIQGNIPQEEKWLEEKVDEILARHLELTSRVEKESPDFIIWPEASYPVAIPPGLRDLHFFNQIKKPLLFGSLTYEGMIPEEWPPQPNDLTFSLYNSAFLMEPGEGIVGRYDKTHLVPLGEYVPLEKWLFFLQKIVPSISSFSEGRELNLMRIPSPLAGEGGRRPGEGVNFGITICYEDLFPEISRTLVRKGAQFLVNLTNDAWYDKASAVYQHFDFSRYRAIENRRSMIRATNTGISGVFSATGEVLASAPLFQEAVLTTEVPVGGGVSFYNRFGDVFAWGCVIGTIVLLLKRRKS